MARRSRECECFHSNLDDLAEAVEPVVERFADQALIANLISQAQSQDARNVDNTPHERASTLIEILLARIEQNSGDFYKVRGILEGIPELKRSADLLRPPPAGGE